MSEVSKEDFARFVEQFDACYERIGGGKLRVEADRVRALVRELPGAARGFVEIHCVMAASQPGFLQPAMVVAAAFLAEFDDRTPLEMVEENARTLDGWQHLSAMAVETRQDTRTQGPPEVPVDPTPSEAQSTAPSPDTHDAPDGRETQTPQTPVDQAASAGRSPQDRDLDNLVDDVLAGAASPAEVEAWVRARGMEFLPADVAVHLRRMGVDVPEPRGGVGEWFAGPIRMARAIKRLVSAAEQVEEDAPASAFPLLAAGFLLASVPGVVRSAAPLAFRAGYAAWRGGEHRHADALLRAAVDLFDKEGEAEGALAALNYRCDSLKQTKRYHDLDGVALQLIERSKATGHRGWAALALRDRGVALAALGRDGALDSIQEAVRIRRVLTEEEARQQSVVPLPGFLDALGTIARQLGNYAESINAFLELSDLQSGVDDSLRALALSDVGYTYMAAGDHQRARDYLLKAADLATACGDPENALRWRLQAGGTSTGDADLEPSSSSITDLPGAYLGVARAQRLAQTGRFEEAYDAARTAMAEAQRFNDVQLALAATSVMGAAAGHLGRHDEAITLFRTALQLADGTRTSDASLQLRYNLAKALIQSKKYTEAGNVLLGGIAHSRVALTKAEGTEFRQEVLAASRAIHDVYVSLAAQADYHRNWVAVAEQSRAQNLRAWLHAERELRGPERSTCRQALHALRHVEIEMEMRHHEGGIDAPVLAALRQRRLEAQRLVDAELETRGLPSVPWTPDDNPFDVADALIDSVAATGRTILYLHSVPEGVCACAAWQGAEGLKLHGRFISTDVGRLRSSMRRFSAAAAGCSLRGAPGRAQADVAALERLTMDVCSQMEGTLLHPLCALLEGRPSDELLVVADADLTFLPWWTLADRLGTGALCLVPSLHVADVCLTATAERSSQTFSLLVGDGTGTLSGARVEVDAVEKLVRPRREVRRPQGVRELSDSLRRCSSLHVAAHGLWNARNPYLSGIVVADEVPSAGTFIRHTDLNGGFFEHAGAGRWRLWTVGEVMTEAALDRCELVVLSACESAIAHDHAAGEMTGLPTAFLLAGAHSVIGSVWPVHDGATTVLMHHFYKCWAGGAGSHTNASRALASARRALQRTSRREALEILGDTSAIPAGSAQGSLDELVFRNPLFSDAFYCYGA
jgi:CHAT domain-containing protein/tetratricopeptide (TPR) repeat protein